MAGKKVLLEVPLGEVEEMAQSEQCDVILLGCNSANAATSVGVLQAFNPLPPRYRARKAPIVRGCSAARRAGEAKHEIGILLSCLWRLGEAREFGHRRRHVDVIE